MTVLSIGVIVPNVGGTSDAIFALKDIQRGEELTFPFEEDVLSQLKIK